MTATDRSSAKRDAAILGLLEETTICAAAERAGIGEATLRRWLRENDEFKKQYVTARKEVFAQALNQLRQGALEAAITLREIAADETAPPLVCASASLAILNSLLKGMGMEKGRGTSR